MPESALIVKTFGLIAAAAPAMLFALLGIASLLDRKLSERVIAFTPVEELHRVIAQRIEAHDFNAIAQRVVQERIDLARGRV